VLYAAYRFAEYFGVRYYLHGDVIPDTKTRFELPDLDEVRKPLFKLRGTLPFHDFPEGPDWWDIEDYKAVLAQLPKLGMNFFSLHTYPEGEPHAEPTVWIGLPEDIGEDGNVNFSYPSTYFNTMRSINGFNWGYYPQTTDKFYYGASQLFEYDIYSSKIMLGLNPQPKTIEESNTLFNRTKNMLRDAFSFANKLGIQTCVGTHTPLVVPEHLRMHLESLGMDSNDSSVIKNLYKGLFKRVMKAYPVDYYWFWTPESWTWRDATEDQINKTLDDLSIAIKAAKEVDVSFDLSTCGWVLGPPSQRDLFDKFLPNNIAVSCIVREIGKAPVDIAFSKISDRSEWVIPWLEDDGALCQPQLWVGRMRKDAFDALRYGCEGLFGIHWRTRLLSPNVAALARASWNQDFEIPEELLTEEPFGPVSGKYISLQVDSIGSTDDPTVYKTMRHRTYGYNLNVPNNNYTITLKFCEPRFTRNRARIFDIQLQGKKVVEEFDIFERAGTQSAVDLVFTDIEVTNEVLKIELTERIRYPVISAIIVEAKDFIKKINCGGSKYKDYDADWPESIRYLESKDFYLDWATNLFGSNTAIQIADILSKIDGELPIVSFWVDGPGGIRPDNRPWNQVLKEYSFVEELAAVKSNVQGAGNKERFKYWMDNFYYMKEMAYLSCTLSEYNKSMKQIEMESDYLLKKQLAESIALPLRIKMIASVKKIHDYLLATVSNKGELGTISNWEQNILPDLLIKPGKELENILGYRLPSKAFLSREYEGPVRIIVPTDQTCLEHDENLKLKVIILSNEEIIEPKLNWRKIGYGDYKSTPLEHVSRGVYTVVCPVNGIDLEYYISVKIKNEILYFPKTAPELNKTVVVLN
ncbi:malectin domain-containing carbohydrate-binding protein, partial [Bacteroidota bacterium]